MKNLIVFDPEMCIPGGNNPIPLTIEKKEEVIKFIIEKTGKMENVLQQSGCKIHVARNGEKFNTRLICQYPSDILSEQFWNLLESDIL